MRCPRFVGVYPSVLRAPMLSPEEMFVQEQTDAETYVR